MIPCLYVCICTYESKFGENLSWYYLTDALDGADKGTTPLSLCNVIRLL